MLKWSLALLAVVAMASNAAAALTPADKGARLMAQMKAAMGGKALDAHSGFHQTGKGKRDGTTVIYETWGDLKTLRTASTQTIDGHTLSGGFDGKVTWSIDPQGTTHVDDSPSTLIGARLGTYLTIGGYFYPDRFPARFEYQGRKKAGRKSFDVVTVTPEGSISVELWLDAATHRLKRVSGTDGKVPFAGVVQRYRLVKGVWIGISLVQTEGSHRIVQSLTSFDFEDVPPERFSPPSATRP